MCLNLSVTLGMKGIKNHPFLPSSLTLSLRRASPRSPSRRTERRAESGNIKRAQSSGAHSGPRLLSQKRLCDITFRSNSTIQLILIFLHYTTKYIIIT